MRAVCMGADGGQQAAVTLGRSLPCGRVVRPARAIVGGVMAALGRAALTRGGGVLPEGCGASLESPPAPL